MFDSLTKMDVPEKESPFQGRIVNHLPSVDENANIERDWRGLPKINGQEKESPFQGRIVNHLPSVDENVNTERGWRGLSNVNEQEKESPFQGRIVNHSPSADENGDTERNWRGLPNVNEQEKESPFQGRVVNHSPSADEGTTGSNNVTASGSSQNVGTFRIKSQNIGEIINLINGINNELNNEWDNIVKNDVNVINNSWASNDAKSYVDKLLNEGNKIKDVVAALKLLSNTYQKVINESENVQQDVQNSINRI